MSRSPVALALVAALGSAAFLTPIPALAQQATPSASSPVRTGSSSIGGAFGVRLSVYDARSFELSWNRIPNAAVYRVQVGTRTVQENGATSRYVGNVDLSGGFDYTLTALDRSGTVLATQRFRVQPAQATQLVAAGGGTMTPAGPATPAAPANPTSPSTPPAAGTSPPTNLRLAVYSATAAELFWQPGTFVDRNEIRRDGVLIATLDGGALRSYFDASRQPGRSYVYEVTAINGAGPASATIGGTGGTGTPTAPANPMAPVGPTNPAAGPIRTGASTIGGDIPVRLAVYDARSYELFWERVPGAATYRLSQSGQVVQESSGVSRFVTGVNGAASFAYTLVALDRSGDAIRSTSFTVSPSAAVQLALGGSGSTPTNPGTNPTSPPAVNDGPIRTGQTSLPGDLDVRLSVYDARAYELFWFRVPGATRYRLSRDGRVVQESDATSFFVGDADSTRRYEYRLEVLDRSGRVLRERAFTVALRGAPQLIAADGGASAPTVPTSPATPTAPGQGQALPPQVQGRLAALFEVAGGDALETVYAVADRLNTLGQSGDLPLVSTTQVVFGTRTRNTYACSRGGTLGVTNYQISGSGNQTDLEARSCAFGPLTVTGTFTRSQPPARGDNVSSATDTSYNVEGYRLIDSRNGSTTTLGRGVAITQEPGQTRVFGTDRRLLDASDLNVSAGSGTSYSATALQSDELGSLATAPAGERGLVVTIAGLRDRRTGDARVETTALLQREGFGENYRTGTLRLIGSGYAYELNADNGDPATFQLDATEGGSTVSYTVPWSTAFGFDRFDPSTVDLGF